MHRERGHVVWGEVQREAVGGWRRVPRGQRGKAGELRGDEPSDDRGRRDGAGERRRTPGGDRRGGEFRECLVEAEFEVEEGDDVRSETLQNKSR